MPAYIGDKEIVAGALGDKELVNIYLGDKEVWGGGKFIDLGSAKTWNIGDYYSKYDELTVDNFLLITADSVSGGDSIKPDGTYQQYVHLQDGMIKNYNSTTGVLEFRTQYDGSSIRQGNTRVVIAPRIDKLTYLGFGNRFDVKNYFPNDYRQMTVSNFAMTIIRHWNTSGNASYAYCCHHGRVGDGYTRYSDDGTFAIVKSYNASTGELTFYGRSWGYASPDSGGWDRICNAHVYASKRPFVV